MFVSLETKENDVGQRRLHSLVASEVRWPPMLDGRALLKVEQERMCAYPNILKPKMQGCIAFLGKPDILPPYAAIFTCIR